MTMVLHKQRLSVPLRVLQGAVYGIRTVKLSQSIDDPYGPEAFAILLPWVSGPSKHTIDQ